MYCSLPIFLLEEEGSDPPEFVASEEGQEPDPSKIDLLCQENFDEGKSILPLMYKLPILSTTTQVGIKGWIFCIVSREISCINKHLLSTKCGMRKGQCFY
jgi:hypothetical protein